MAPAWYNADSIYVCLELGRNKDTGRLANKYSISVGGMNNLESCINFFVKLLRY